ncbi:uncharacterized protein LOC112574895 isoform X2 [Pomacea canaliculata]|uniref:uncharacterized protein LOC112574895 isoform X2 n=1 Tax=Pomacea canaliculata TaxID=400727 RepID=UPI000D72A33E|nr:uncharacterized protein LOC112574895 isoform X2 [Pomacea canaliculata]
MRISSYQNASQQEERLGPSSWIRAQPGMESTGQDSERDFLQARSPVRCLGFTSRTGKAVLSLLVASVYKCKLLDLDKVLVERQLRYDLLMLTFCPEGKNQLAVDCLFRVTLNGNEIRAEICGDDG